MNKPVAVAVVAGLAVVFAFVAGLAPAQNQAEATVTPFPSREKVISVSGVATASVEPDLLVVTFGVENQEETAAAALRANSDTVTSVVDAVLSAGISEDELSTSRISIHPVYDGYRDPVTDRYTQELVGFRAANTLTVRTPQLDMAAGIIDGAVSAGANRVDDVSFTLSPQKQLEVRDGLLEEAVINARQKAENALAPLDHEIIGVKAVSLSEFGMPSPMRVYNAAESFAGDAGMKASTPVFFSDQDVTTTASVVFLIGSS